MIKDFVFDMGNVLILYRPELFVTRLDVSLEDQELLLKHVFHAKEWAMMDDGSLHEADLMALLKDRLPVHLHAAVETLVTAWDEPMIEMEGMRQLIAELKAQGYGIYLLSNASRRQHVYWPRIPASKYFDGKLISADVRMVKPHPGIYQKLFDTFNLRPETSFFIDDLAANVAAAERLGMRSHLFDGDIDTLRQAIVKVTRPD